MNDAEKIRHLAIKLKAEGYALLSKETDELADRIEKLERLVREMAEGAIVWDDSCYYCVFCQAGDYFEDRVPHADDCPVSVAKKEGVIK